MLYSIRNKKATKREGNVEKNFMCIAITKEIINKKVFSVKEAVYAYFQQKFEAEIHEEQKIINNYTIES